MFVYDIVVDGLVVYKGFVMGWLRHSYDMMYGYIRVFLMDLIGCLVKVERGDN